MKKSILAGLICLFGASGAHAAAVSTASGNWEDAGIWTGGFPGAGTGVEIQGHSVTSSTAIAAANLKTLNAASELVFDDGTVLDVPNIFAAVRGSMILKAGSAISQSTAQYLMIGTDNNSLIGDGTMVVDGGTFDTTRAIFLGKGNTPGVKATLDVRDGAVTIGNKIIFGGAANSEERIFITGGSLQCTFLDFDQGTNPGGGTQTGEVTVAGGDLILTANEADSIAFAGSYNKVFYESGVIVFKACNSQTEFDAFVPVFDGWVDAGNVTSTNHTPAELKSMLRYSLGDAYLSISTDDLPAPLTMSTVAAGSWTNGATWNAGFSPRNDDVAYVKHNVAASDVVLDINTLATLEDAADLQLGTGTELDVLNGLVINKGIITVGTGASLSKGSGSEYIHLPRDGSRTSELHVDGGTVYSAKAVFLGAQSNDTGADGTLRVSGGSITSPNQLIFGGGASSVAKMYLTGGTAQFSFIDFDQHETQGDVGQTEELHVDGGDLILTYGDEANAIQFAGDYSKLFFESGAVAIRGVDTQADFNTFTNTFNGWVDAGNVTSAVHSASTLKSMLYYIGSDAILTDTPADPPALQQTSVASGAWSSGATWDTGIAPRDGDYAWIMDDDVTASGVTVTLGGTLALINGEQGSLTLSDGSDFDVFGALPIMDGELSIESGSSLSVYENGENYIQIGRDAGTTGALTIDGGTYYAERAMFNTLWNSPNATGTITVANGSLLSPDWQIIFGGASNSVSKMFINEGGTVECLFIDFDQIDDDPSKNGNGTQYEEVTIDGGDLILTGDDYTNAIEFAGSYSKVFFEGGSITVKGVDTIEDFNNYVPLYEAAVDAQYFDSVTYTDEELKAMLQYSFEGDAVVTEGEVLGYGTMTTTVTGSDSMDITSIALLPGATNVLQFRTDLMTGSWSNLTGVTGTSSNTWEIAPLNDPKCFFRIIVE